MPYANLVPGCTGSMVLNVKDNVEEFTLNTTLIIASQHTSQIFLSFSVSIRKSKGPLHFSLAVTSDSVIYRMNSTNQISFEKTFFLPLHIVLYVYDKYSWLWFIHWFSSVIFHTLAILQKLMCAISCLCHLFFIVIYFGIEFLKSMLYF